MNLLIARVILVGHISIVVGLVSLGLWVAFVYPPLLIVAAPLGVITALLNWGKGCPLTVYEKQYLGAKAYKGTCTPHYVKQWLGVSIPQQLVPGIYLVCCLISLVRLSFQHF